ncbi:UDP-N-acetylenolpyruvoylglucosamine reductase, partial [Bordetella pertussis]
MSTVPARIEPVAPLAPQAQDLRCFNTLGLASHAPAFVALTEPSQLPALSALAPRFRQLVV